MAARVASSAIITAKGNDSPMPNPKKGLPPGTLAPDFTLPTAGGASIHLGDYRGRWVTLFFFRGVF